MRLMSKLCMQTDLHWIFTGFFKAKIPLHSYLIDAGKNCLWALYSKMKVFLCMSSSSLMGQINFLLCIIINMLCGTEQFMKLLQTFEDDFSKRIKRCFFFFGL